MTAQFCKNLFLATVVVAASAGIAMAQTNKKPRQSAYGGTQTQTQQKNKSAYGGAADTVKPNNNQSAYGNAGNTGKGIDTTLPIEVIRTGSSGLLDSVKISLRNDAGIDQNLIRDKAPMPYEPIREDDAVYRVRVWREIDAREKMNLPFVYSADEDNGNQRFISIVLRAIKNGELTAFSGDDDRFTTPITPEAAFNAFGSGNDTVPKYDRDGNVIGYQVRPKAVDPDSIYKFRIKEDWIYDKESSRLFVRIIGIAPVIPFKLSTGQALQGSERAVWWIYYPDARPIFSKTEVYNPKNYSSRMSWEDLFESRMFSSYIIKSTYDNPFDLPFSAIHPNNTLFRLLEGERVKEKIFNYEQSLWAY